MILRIVAGALFVWTVTAPANAQTFSQRGFVESRVLFYPQDTLNDSTNLVADLLVREEATVKLAPWLQFAGAGDVRANSHDQVDAGWTFDFFDRGLQRPMVSIRRINATLTTGRLTIDAGKQFMRWGKTDIVTPTDRVAPRDFLNVIDSEYLPITGVRVDVQLGDDTLEGIWVPVLTPSRVPLVDQRWSGIQDLPDGVTIVQRPAVFPSRDQFGLRWSRAASGYDLSLAYFDGLNHLPDVAASLSEALELSLQPRYPRLRMYGGDVAWPMPWVTLKGEAAYMTAPDADSDEFVLYAVQAERQQGEWQFIGGYVGDVSTANRTLASFSPERGLAKSIVGRASYTIDTNRSAAAEALVRQNGDAFYCKGEYSWARGQHWRTTVSAALIRGEPDDFLGQYDRNSHFNLTLRYSF